VDATRVGVVGAGWIAEEHVATISGLEDADVVAVCDLEPARAEALASKAGARAYGDWGDLLEKEDLGALFVCVPPLAHREPALAAIERGLPLYLEKPIARNLEDALAIAAAAARSGTVCAVGYQWHALDLLDDVADLLAGQEIGLLVGTSIGPTASRPWFLDRKAGGGNLLERGSHHLDLVRTVGGEVRSVQALGGRVQLARGGAGAGDIDDAVTILLELASGGVAAVVVAWTKEGQPGTYSLDVVAGEATLRLVLDPDFSLGGVSRGQAVNRRGKSLPFERSVRRFITAARSGHASQVFCPPGDAVRTLAVAVAAEEALESRRAVVVEALDLS
jgi:predicted dehydrogenase